MENLQQLVTDLDLLSS